MRVRVWWVVCSCCLLLPLVALGQAQLGTWRSVREDDGIESFRRELPNRALPAYRASVVLDQDMWRLLAILEDVDRAAEWTAHCDNMRKVRTLGDREMLVYARMDAPWPVRDRDVVVKVSARVEGPTELHVTIRSLETPALPPVDGVVRMPRMDASYHFVALGARRTRVDYEVEVDTGGTLPDWLKRMVSRDLAHDTLDRLRSRARWDAEHGVYTQRAGELRKLALRTERRNDELAGVRQPSP